MGKIRNVFASILRDATFGVALFILILILALVASKATHFIYAMF